MSTTDQVRWLQRITIAWMTVEAALALLSAWRANSPAMLAFGGDSLLELASAVVVLWSFLGSSAPNGREKLAAHITGGLLIVLAAYVAIISIYAISGRHEPKTSFLGIATLLLAAIIMPLLARRKRQLSGATKSAALRADATQSAVCAYLAWIALVGLIANAAWHVPWMDAFAALAMLPLIILEGIQVLKGEVCGCH